MSQKRRPKKASPKKRGPQKGVHKKASQKGVPKKGSPNYADYYAGHAKHHYAGYYAHYYAIMRLCELCENKQKVPIMRANYARIISARLWAGCTMRLFSVLEDLRQAKSKSRAT